MDFKEMIHRAIAGQKIIHIAQAMGHDPKTVRKYLTKVDAHRSRLIESGGEIPADLIPTLHGRPAEKQDLLEPHLDEIKMLITNAANPLKPKTAFEVICIKHDLADTVSYSSFKRFVRTHSITILPDKATCRIECEPASQVQVDYMKAGLLFDPFAGRRRIVYAFIGSLSFSRYKYVEFTFSQNQQSFINSHVKMFHAFGGVPKSIGIDNLKAGVISPDLYEPRLNRAYREMAEHYGCFIDPCRVASPRDKGKVERDVQTIREQFRKLSALHPRIIIDEANTAIANWLRNDYGARKHGTTHQEPYKLFTEIEQPLLLPLPLEPYEAALWKEATVHPDHYIQVNKKAYSIPHPYVGKKVWVKVTHNLVQVYYNDQLIKQHPVAQGFRQTDFNDFPENVQHAINTGMPAYLCNEAASVGKDFETLVRKILAPHAFLNLRRAQGIVSLASKYPKDCMEQAATLALDLYCSVTPGLFKTLLENLQNHDCIEQSAQLSLSMETQSFVRDMTYFIQNNTEV